MSQVLTSAIGDTIREEFAGTDVTKLRLSGPDGLHTNVYGLFTDDGTHIPRSAVTEQYLPHTVDDIAALAEAASVGFDAESNAMVQTLWTGTSHKVVLGPTMRHQASIANPMDKIWPRVVITGGFSGQGFTAEAGLYRFACSNLEMIKRIKGHRVSFKHTHSLRHRIDELVVNFRELATKWDQVVDFSMALNGKTVSTEEFLTNLYPLPETATRLQVNSYRNRARRIVNRIIRERQKLNVDGRHADVSEATLWELVNGVTGYIQHDKTRQGRTNDVTRAFAGVADRESDAAWSQAEAMLSA